MYLSCANISQKYKECPKESLIKTKEKLHKTINPHNPLSYADLPICYFG